MKIQFPQFCSVIFLLAFASLAIADSSTANSISFNPPGLVVAGDLKSRIDQEKFQNEKRKAGQQSREAERKIRRAEEKIKRAEEKFREGERMQIEAIESAVQKLLAAAPGATRQEAIDYLKQTYPDWFDGLENRY